MEKHRKQHLMYSSLPNIIIGFHGCDISVYNNILHNHNTLRASNNSYDWLGNGIYFWEQNLERAWQWAREGAQNPKINITTPAVIGAVIDLGNCLNLLDSRNLQLLKTQYEILSLEAKITGKPLPQNKKAKDSDELLLRFLDCAVIERLHNTCDNSNFMSPFDSVRGVFFEGNPIYDTSGFTEKAHIQICVRNPNCIKGYFAPMEIDDNWQIP